MGNKNSKKKEEKKQEPQKETKFVPKYNPFVISGPSGVGKGAITELLFKDFGEYFSRKISHTTRAIRTDETADVSYYFVSKEQFEADIKAEKFVEYALVHNNYYGTQYSSIAAASKDDKICVLELNVEGVQIMKKKYSEKPEDSFHCNYLWIAPLSYDDLFVRLKNRGTDSDELIATRLETAKVEKELIEKNPTLYENTLINDKLDKAYMDLLELIVKCYPHMKEPVEKVLAAKKSTEEAKPEEPKAEEPKTEQPVEEKTAESDVPVAEAAAASAAAGAVAASSDEPKSEEPAPVAEEPKAEEPAPVAEEPKAEEPAPVAEEPKAEEPAPVAEEPKAEEPAPVAEEPKAEEPAPVAEEPKAEEPAPVAEEPKAEEPAPVPEEPKAEEPAPVPEEPKAEEPAPAAEEAKPEEAEAATADAADEADDTPADNNNSSQGKKKKNKKKK